MRDFSPVLQDLREDALSTELWWGGREERGKRSRHSSVQWVGVVGWILMTEWSGPPEERESVAQRRRASDFGLMGRWAEGKWLWDGERTLGSLSCRVENSSSLTDAYSQPHSGTHTLGGTHTHTHTQSQCPASMCNSLSASLLNPEQPLSSRCCPPSLPSLLLSNLIITISPLFSSVAPSHSSSAPHQFCGICSTIPPFITSAYILLRVASGKLKLSILAGLVALSACWATQDSQRQVSWISHTISSIFIHSVWG